MASACAVSAFQAAPAVCRPSRRSAVVCAAQQPAQSRRQQLAGLAGLAALVAARPASAGLFGGAKEAAERYEKETAQVITDVRNAATLDRDAPNREEVMAAVRKEINDWVATYRRQATFSGRPSYGNVYSAVNAMAGHLNSFGPTAPVPKKRLERMVKELDDAEKFLARGR